MLWEGISSYLLRRTPSFSELQVFFLIPRCFFFLSQLLPTFFTPSVMGTHLSVFLLFLVLATDGFSSQGNGDDGAFSLSIWTQDSIDGSRGLNSSTLFFLFRSRALGRLPSIFPTIYGVLSYRLTWSMGITSNLRTTERPRYLTPLWGERRGCVTGGNRFPVLFWGDTDLLAGIYSCLRSVRQTSS